VSVGELSCDIDRAALVTVVQDAEDDQLVTWGDADAITARVGASTRLSRARRSRATIMASVMPTAPWFRPDSG
jgi:hypothetical protein